MGTATVNYTGVSNTGNVLIDALSWGSKWESAGPTVITVGFYGDVESYDASGNLKGSRDLSAAEITAIQTTLNEYAKYINVTFTFMGEDSSEQSDIQFVLTSDKRSDYLGEAYPPGEQGRDPDGNPGFSEVWVYTNNYATVSGALAPGGYDYITFIHEFGHAMGLAHPHDDGGTTSDPSLVFPGVPFDQPFNNYGNNGLNQGIYTTMSYNDGWPEKVKAADKFYGYQGGLMALDIQALQHIYGANTSYASGADSYVLPSLNRIGTYFSCIWDTGGVDEIVQSGKGACVIDLRPATGVAGEGGGGFISQVKGIRGGFTIAVGATIENATGGRAADTLIGNSADNTLTGLGGKDYLTGGGGADTFVFTSIADTSAYRFRADVIRDFMTGVDKIAMVNFDSDAVLAGTQLLSWDFIGTDPFMAAGEIRTQYVSAQNITLVLLNTDGDSAAEGQIVLSGNVDLTINDFIFI